MKTLIAIPLFNEEKTIKKLIGLIKKYTGSDILIIDDGSSDNSVKILRSVKNIKLLRNSVRKGYGSTLQKIFDFSIKNNYKYLITLDADLQHEPLYIPEFMKFIQRYDIVSGSRYLKNSKIKSPAPEKRRYVNLIITKIINRITNYNLTDSFCGFKGYKVESLRKIRLSSKGLAAPL